MAPAYALTATLGILAVSVGAKTPVVVIAGFLRMFSAAYAYQEFNKIMLDSGTSFTWTSKAFGPYIGWRARQSAFFRGGAIIHESAHAQMAKYEHLLVMM